MKLPDYINDMFRGKKINFTENRAVLHSALRDSNLKSIKIEDTEVAGDILREREKFKNFVKKFENGEIKGYTNKIRFCS